MSDEQLEKVLADPRILRAFIKILAQLLEDDEDESRQVNADDST